MHSPELRIREGKEREKDVSERDVRWFRSEDWARKGKMYSDEETEELPRLYVPC